jgi:predicted chitinase
MLYGYGDGIVSPKKYSTFVRNIDLKTAITPEYASMVTVGATAGGYVKGTEATMFSKWNKGITDRFSPKLEPGDPETSGNTSYSFPPQLKPSGGIAGGAINALSQFNGDEALVQYIVKFYATGKLALGYKYDGNGETPQLDNTAIENNKSIVTEFYKYAHSKIHEQYPDWSSPTIGFIPFSLGLTMDGLAGIKIYNAVKVDTSFLPTNYPDSLSFIITGVDHKLSNNDWETTIQTHVIPETEKQNGTPTASPSQIKDTVLSLLNGAGIGNVQLDTTLGNNNSGIGNAINEVIKNAPGVFGKRKWFSPNPLKEYKGSDWIIDHEGWNDYKTGTSRGKNIDLIITEFRKAGLKNPYAMVGILAVNSKESNFILKNGENMNYNKGRLPEVWAAFSTTGKVVAKGDGKKYANSLATKYANDPENLSNFVYGSKDSVPQGMRSSNADGGNKNWGDGWKYRGRGWNGLTFKGAYEKYGKKIGKDIVNNPELMEDPQIATQVLIEYYKSAFASKNGGAISFINSLPTVEDAIYYFAGSTAGWVDNSSTGWQGGFNKALANKDRFKIIYK